MNEWPDGVRPEPTEPEAEDEPTDPDEDLKAVVFGLVKAMSPEGISVGEIVSALEQSYDDVPSRQTVTKWLREDDRIYKPTGYKKYAVRPEEGS